MWISRQHFDLIRSAAAEFRAYHEECMRAKDERIRSQEARLAAMESERRELVEKMLSMLTVVHPPTTITETAEVPDSSWESIMRRQIEEINGESGRDTA